MYPPHLRYLTEKGITWFNPSYGLNGFWDEHRKLGQKLNMPSNLVWKHRDLKRAKEIYTISILAKAMAKQEGAQWWIHKPKNDPPDGVIGTIVHKNGMDVMQGREVEVVEHVGGNLLDTIRNKVSKKQYEPNTILICYLSTGGLINPEKISTEICKEVTKLDNIFLAFPGFQITELPKNASQDELLRAMFKVVSVQVKPVYSSIIIDPLKDCKDWREGKEGNFFIFEGRGKGDSRPISLNPPPKLF